MRKPRDYSHLPIETQFNYAYTRALRFLSYRARSIKEINEYLKQKGFEALIVSNVIELLLSQKFLNDKDFAEQWIEQRQKNRAKSKSFIKQELKQKGIDEDIIEETLQIAEDDLKTAKEFFEKKKKRFDRFTGEEYFQKAAAFLQRRGFSWDVVKEVLKEYN